MEREIRLNLEAKLQERKKTKKPSGSSNNTGACHRQASKIFSRQECTWLQKSAPMSFKALAGEETYTSGEYKGRNFAIDPGNILFCVGIWRIFFGDSLLDPEEETANITCDWIAA